MEVTEHQVEIKICPMRGERNEGGIPPRVAKEIQYGVRELRRVVEKLVQIPLSELILAGKLVKGSQWQLARQGEDLVFRVPQK